MSASRGGGRRRADAERSRLAILDAAIALLNELPDASVETIAQRAGVTRQTVYAHFPSREELLAAAIDRVTEEVAAALDVIGLDEGAAVNALMLLLEVSGGFAAKYAGLFHLSPAPENPETDRKRHQPIADRLSRVIRRGQHAGEFDVQLPVQWLVAATIALGHAAAEEAAAGRMDDEQASLMLRTSLLRILGVPESAGMQ